MLRLAPSMAAWGAFLLGGCEAVPSLTFEDAGGAESGSPDAADTGAAEEGCPGAAPQNATCCNDVPCFGPFCTPAACLQCETCAASEICCTKSANNAMCVPATTLCR